MTPSKAGPGILQYSPHRSGPLPWHQLCYRLSSMNRLAAFLRLRSTGLATLTSVSSRKWGPSDTPRSIRRSTDRRLAGTAGSCKMSDRPTSTLLHRLKGNAVPRRSYSTRRSSTATTSLIALRIPASKAASEITSGRGTNRHPKMLGTLPRKERSSYLRGKRTTTVIHSNDSTSKRSSTQSPRTRS